MSAYFPANKFSGSLRGEGNDTGVNDAEKLRKMNSEQSGLHLAARLKRDPHIAVGALGLTQPKPKGWAAGPRGALCARRTRECLPAARDTRDASS